MQHPDRDVEPAAPAEDQPLLQSASAPEAMWKPPRGFVWIQIGNIPFFLYIFPRFSFSFRYSNHVQRLPIRLRWYYHGLDLITSTAFQPLYGRFSDIFGRRTSFFTATITFIAGCIGCGVARDIVTLNLMRALTGIGGGGLMTMATIVNSDLIPFRRRGMYQALQNGMNGFGAVCGASFGGSIVDTIGWRWCFIMQVPVGLFALVTGYLVINLSSPSSSGLVQPGQGLRAIWKYIDLSGACLLILGLSSQLVGLSLGGNELPWSDPWVIGSLVGSVVLLALFVFVEGTTSAIPLIPLRMLKGVLPVATQISNVCVGMAAYAFLFTLPLLFQVILLDSASKAGARLAVPSLAAPIGSLVSGIVMSRWGKLAHLVRTGAALMCVGNFLVMLLQFNDSEWKYYVYVIPASLGQGIVYPGILFTFLAAFDHADHAVSASTVYLVRSLGTVWGVAITSTIVQNTLRSGLAEALSGVPDKWKLIDDIRHSVSAIYTLPPEVQMAARLVYYRGIRLSFLASACFGLVATIAALFTRGKGLHRPGEA